MWSGLKFTGSRVVRASPPHVACDATQSGNRRDRPGVDFCTVEARKELIMRDERGRKVETSVEARAGFLDRPVLIVLCVSLALGLVVLGALWLGFFAPGA